MKIFTLSEANETLATIVPMVHEIRRRYLEIQELKPAAKAASDASSHGGGMAGGSRYVSALYETGRLMARLAELGVEVRDPERGLIDLPSMKDGRVVFLCWQIGEGDKIDWWHETYAGFDGRQPIDRRL